MKPDDSVPQSPLPGSAPPERQTDKTAQIVVLYGLCSVLLCLVVGILFPPNPVLLYLFLVALLLGGYAIAGSLRLLLGRTYGRRRPVLVGLGGLLFGLCPFALLAVLFTFPFHERHPGSRSSSNIRQLAVAIAQYAQDNDGYLPGWVKNPDGRYAHNVWDQQISQYVKRVDIYRNEGAGIASPSQPAPRDRVVSYGMNGLLLARPDSRFDPDWSRPVRHRLGSDSFPWRDGKRPKPVRAGDIANPAGTILLAELDATDVGRWPGFARPTVLPYTRDMGTGDAASRAWRRAVGGETGGGTIDISPRSWVEPAGYGNVANYQEPYRHAAGRGVARALYGGGGNYAFCDGHVQFLRIGKSVGIGTRDLGDKEVTVLNCWKDENTNNMWIPFGE